MSETGPVDQLADGVADAWEAGAEEAMRRDFEREQMEWFDRTTPDEPFDTTDAAERAGASVDWIDYYRRGLDNDPANYGACRD